VYRLPSFAGKVQLHALIRTFTGALSTGLVALLVAGCDSDQSSTAMIETDNLALPVPARIRNIAAIDLDAINAIAVVNAQVYTLARQGNRFQTAINDIPKNSPVSISLRFTETLPGGEVIDLASHPEITRNIGNANVTVEFLEADYKTDFDIDGDGCHNIVEREVGTDPLVFDDNSPDNLRVVTFDLPDVIPNPQFTQVIATFAGIVRAYRRTGNTFEISGNVPRCSNVGIEVLLLQRFNGQRIVVATATRSIGSAENIQLNDADFNYDQDTDGDGLTNITELNNGTNPLVPN